MPNPLRKPTLLVARGLDPVGTGRQIELVAAALRAAGRDVHVAATTTGGSLADRLAAAGFPVHRVGRRPVVDAAAAAALVALVARLRPAAVAAWGRSQLPLAAACRVGWPRARLLGWLARPVRGRAAATILRRLDHVIAATPAVAESCARLGIADGTVARIAPGILPPDAAGLSRAEVAGRLGLDPARQWTLCVAPLEADSRLERLLWAIDQLGVVRQDLEHVLVGAGPLAGRVGRRARLQELATRLVVVPHCRVLPDLLRHVRLVWQSGAAALGGAILDALAAGVPVVTVAGDAASQLVVDGESGRVVPPLPESEFPRGAFSLLEDESRAARMAAAGAARAAACFSAASSVAAHVALHERLAE